MIRQIPFNQVTLGGIELDLVREAFGNRHLSGDGPFSRKSEEILSEMHDGSRVLLTPSCSHALELAARLIDIQPGDEVIVPSFAFPTTVSSFVAQGAVPVFCDIDPLTLGLNLLEAQELITPKTKAIVLIHYGGVPADPEGFARLAKQHGLVLIEDNAHGLGGSSDGKTLGTFGAMSALSFHETKNISCGEGGALVINESSYVSRAEILRQKGTDRNRFFRGEVDKYTWQDLGSSWVLSEILSAILYGQLLRFDEIQARRQAVWETYLRELSGWALENKFSLSKAGHGTAHLFYVLARDRLLRERLIRHLKSRQVTALFHYAALHLSPFGSQFAIERPLPVTEAITDSLVRLPLYSSLKDEETNSVVKAVRSYTPN